jgi:hypothetical protein
MRENATRMQNSVKPPPPTPTRYNPRETSLRPCLIMAVVGRWIEDGLPDLLF